MKTRAMEEWVWKTLESGLSEGYTYHNMAHTSMVQRDLATIAAYYQVDDYNYKLLNTAALFHDIAFVNSHIDHEAASADMAAEVLPGYGYKENEIERIRNMIMATKLPQSPQTFFEGILCDADLFYLGGEHYFEIAAGLKEEWRNIGHPNTERQWIEAQLDFLRSHRYHTAFALKKQRPGKQKIVQQLEIQLAALD